MCVYMSVCMTACQQVMDFVDPGGSRIAVSNPGRVVTSHESGTVLAAFVTPDNLLIPVDFVMSRDIGGVRFEGEITAVTTPANDVSCMYLAARRVARPAPVQALHFYQQLLLAVPAITCRITGGV
jgi:hypothetical protein